MNRKCDLLLKKIKKSKNSLDVDSTMVKNFYESFIEKVDTWEVIQPGMEIKVMMCKLEGYIYTEIYEKLFRVGYVIGLTKETSFRTIANYFQFFAINVFNRCFYDKMWTKAFTSIASSDDISLTIYEPP